jgi:hypothetical protein
MVDSPASASSDTNGDKKPVRRLRYRITLPLALLFSLVAAIITYFSLDRSAMRDLDPEAEWLFVITVWFVAYAVIFLPSMALVTFQMNKAARDAQKRD